MLRYLLPAARKAFNSQNGEQHKCHDENDRGDLNRQTSKTAGSEDGCDHSNTQERDKPTQKRIPPVLSADRRLLRKQSAVLRFVSIYRTNQALMRDLQSDCDEL